MTLERPHALLTMTTASLPGLSALMPVTLRASEEISRPFVVHLDLMSEQGDIKPEKMIDEAACVTIHSRETGNAIRYFHGHIRSFSAGVASAQFWRYRAVLVPKLWFMEQAADCRVFQNQPIGAIVQQVLRECGVQHIDLRVGKNPPREYVVQFNETNLAFVTRLIHEAGWFYYFTHAKQQHVMVIGDGNTAFTTVPDADFTFTHNGPAFRIMHDWHKPVSTVHGKVTLKDYNPDTPNQPPQHQTRTRQETGGADARQVFLWPAGHRERNDVDDRTQRTMEAAEAAASLCHAASHHAGFLAGGKFSMQQHPVADDGAYVIRSIEHIATDHVLSSDGGAQSYSNSFTAFPVGTPWRHAPVLLRPRMEGIHSAVVIGPPGEEIHTDKQGRVKVRFHWDHRGDAKGDQDSCWARVIQPWAGAQWGAQFIPRVGTEVAVAFIDADPYQPVVVGGLYNGRQEPIYSKDEATKSGFRSRSTPSGDRSQCSEFTFEDKKGEELVLLHAQKDLRTEVEHDETLRVDNCRIVKVAADETIEIGKTQSLKIGSGRTTEITDGNDALTIKTGDYRIDVSMGSVKCTAMQAIELVVGSSSLKIDQAGVTVNGTLLKLTGSASTQIKGAMTEVNGDGMLTLKGGVTMIN